MSVKSFLNSASCIVKSNLQIFKSALTSLSPKFMTKNFEDPSSTAQLDFQNLCLLNENFCFPKHSYNSPPSYGLRENFANNENTNKSNFINFVSINPTYAVCCSTMTRTTSVFTSSIMSSSPYSPISPNVFPTWSNYRPISNFDQSKNIPYTPVQSGNSEKSAFVNSNGQSSQNLPTFMPQQFHANNPEFHFNSKEMSGLIEESPYNICKRGNEDVVRSDVVPPTDSLFKNSENRPISAVTPSQFASACFTLPPISIEKFEGNISEYKEFQIKVKSILTMANYPEELKVIFLKSFLSGDPLSSVSGIMPDDPDAFSAIWDILDEDYGAPDLVRDHHLSLLLSINSWSPCITNKDLKHLYRHISTHYTMLKHFGSEALEEAEAVKIFILPLLTGHAGYKVAKLHQSGKNYNIPEILKILKSIISHQKFVESAKSIKSNLELNKKHLLSSKKNESSLNQIPNVHQNVYSSESNVCTKLEKSSTSISYLEKSSTLRYNCPICETDSHHHSKCKKYQNRDEFWCHIKKNRLCANCLRPGHVWKECFKEHSCQLGGCLRLDKHAPVLCRKFYL